MDLTRLNDLSCPDLKVFSGFTDSELRRGLKLNHRYPTGLFVAESMLVAERALAAGLTPVSMLLEDRWLQHESALVEKVQAAAPQAPVYLLSHELFQQLTGYMETRGALTAFIRPALAAASDLVAEARRVVVLENIINYTNMGAVFRNAAALGADAVLLSPSCHDPLYRRALRVSMGTAFQVPWTRIPQGAWPHPALDELHDLGFTTVALALRDDSLSLGDPELARHERLALLLGTEGTGLTQEAIDACDLTVRIPMAHAVDSLNVATAGAVALWELRDRGQR